MNKFRELREQLTSGQVAGDPWSHVDTSGEATFYKTLTASFKGLKSVNAISLLSQSFSVSSAMGHTVIRGSGTSPKSAFFGFIPSSKISQLLMI